MAQQHSHQLQPSLFHTHTQSHTLSSFSHKQKLTTEKSVLAFLHTLSYFHPLTQAPFYTHTYFLPQKHTFTHVYAHNTHKSFPSHAHKLSHTNALSSFSLTYKKLTVKQDDMNTHSLSHSHVLSHTYTHSSPSHFLSRATKDVLARVNPNNANVFQIFVDYANGFSTNFSMTRAL